jgi:hypothetical protein
VRQTSFKCFSRIKIEKIVQTFDSSFHDIDGDGVLSLNNSRFDDYLIYLNDFEVKDTTDTQMPACYLDLHIEIDNGGR